MRRLGTFPINLKVHRKYNKVGGGEVHEKQGRSKVAEVTGHKKANLLNVFRVIFQKLRFTFL